MKFDPDTRCPCTVRPAVNYGERAPGVSIDMLLLHYTGMETGEAAIDWLCREESGVSCHYVVEEDGSILQLVPEEKRAWHAGKSEWLGETDTNSRSIGIEIVNPGHGNGYPDFPNDQIAAVIGLCGDIVDRNRIAPRMVLAHSDVAPGRKQDPGEKFPWARLFEKGVGLWVAPDDDVADPISPGDNSEQVAEVQALLSAFGYGLKITGDYCEKTKACVAAFQMHFRQNGVSGLADLGTRGTLERLLNSLTLHTVT